MELMMRRGYLDGALTPNAAANVATAAAATAAATATTAVVNELSATKPQALWKWLKDARKQIGECIPGSVTYA